MSAKAVGMLARLQRQTSETALQVLEDLREKGFSFRLDGDRFFVKPEPDSEQSARIKAHKHGILVLLRPWPPFTFPMDWEVEWQQEADVLYRRQAAARTPLVRQKLAELAAERPRSLEEWLDLGERINRVTVELREAGELPPIGYFDRDPPLVWFGGS